MNSLNTATLVATLLVCGGGLAKGRWPERWVAGALLAFTIVGFAPAVLQVWGLSSAAGHSADISLVLDLALLAVLLCVAVRARPVWTLFPAAFQLLATLVSLVNVSSGHLDRLAYVTAQNTFWWITLCAVAYGSWGAASVAGGPAERARA